MDITHITSLLGGIALFLYGMSIMGAGLEKLAGGRPMHVVGDCKAPREVANAIRAAYVTAMQIC